MSDFSSILLFALILALFAGLIYGIVFLMNRQKKLDTINAIKNGRGVFMKWNYSHEEWKAVAEEFFEIKPSRSSENAVASFTAENIFVTNGSQDILFELVGSNRFVKHLTDIRLHKQTEVKALRFEVRTKVIKKDEHGQNTMEEDCDVDTFYVPIPQAVSSDAEKVLNFYKKILDDNADAVAAVMPFGLGMFGK